MKKLTIEFQSEDDLRQWTSWYIDGGGEYNAKYYTNSDKSDWKNFTYLYVERDEDFFLAMKIHEECMLWFSEKPDLTKEEWDRKVYKKYKKTEDWVDNQLT